MITINDLTVKCQQKTILNLPGRLQINAGECIGIIGANGAGKSTFINTLLGRAKYIGQVETSLRGHDIAVHFKLMRMSTRCRWVPLSKRCCRLV